MKSNYERLKTKIQSEYIRVAKWQNSKYGNHLGESECADKIADVLDIAIGDGELTLKDALKMCYPFAKAEYGEYGLTPGIVGSILSKYVKNHLYRMKMESKLVY